MAEITNSQFHILENEIKDNIDLKANLNILLNTVRKTIACEIHSTCKALTKSSDADVELYKDYEVLDRAAWTLDYVDLLTLDALRDLVNKTIVEEVAKNIVKHSEGN